MTIKNNQLAEDAAALRHQAEAKWSERKKKTGPLPAGEADNLRLVHELEVHQIELEMQNEELAQSRAEVDALLLQYTNLYDFAPVGYFTLARDGAIRQANLAGSRLLGVEVGKLIKRRFGVFVSVESRPAFNAFLEKVFTSGGKEACEVALLKDGPGPLWAHMEASTEDKQECRAVVVDITERKLAEEALRALFTRHKAILAAVPDIIMEVNKDKVYTWANPAGLAFFGEDVIGKEAAFYFEGEQDTYDIVNPLFNSSEEVIYIESLQRRKDGEKRWLAWWCRVLKDADGNVVAVLSSANDITERKRTEQALAESEIKFRWLYEYAPSAYHLLKLDGTIMDVNRRWCELLGYRREEALGKAIFDFVVEEQRQAARASFEQKKQSRQPYVEGSERDFKTKDGTVRTFKTYDFFALDEGQNITYVQTTIEDITERKQAKETLQKSEKRFRAIVEHSLEEISLVDTDGTLTYESPTLRRPLGYPPNSFVGHNLFDLFHPDERVAAAQLLKQVVKHPGSVQEAVFRLRHQDGSWRWMEGSLTNLLDEPAVQSVVINYRDITERKRAEQEIASLAKFPSENPNPVLRLSRDGVVMYANEASGAFLGMWGCAVGGSAPQFWRDLTAQALASMENKIVDIECDGKVYAMFITPVAGLDYMNIYGRDITERKRSADRIQRQLEHLTALSGIDRVISANFDLTLSLLEILKHVTVELGVDAADILIVHSGLQILEYGAERGFRSKAIRNTPLHFGESFAGRIVLERQLIRIPNLREEPNILSLTTRLTGEDFICYYGVPLIIKGQVKGVLEIFHRAALQPDAEWLDFLNTLAGEAAIAVEIATLFESLQRSNLELSQAYDATIEGWSQAMDMRDKETEGHTQRVTEMTVKIGRAFGLSEKELVQVRWGAVLHDIGKLGVPDKILLKPGPLTDKEWVVMKKHPTFAYEMIFPIRYLRSALDIPYCHHEKWDGTGYPRGLKGTQIPLVARIFAVVDVWDALKSDRPYRAGWTEEKVLEHIRTLSGTHFDPQVVDAFMQTQNLI